MFSKYTHQLIRHQIHCLRSAGGVLIFIFFVTTGIAQTDQPGFFIKGLELFKQNQYYEAIQYFEKFLQTEIKVTPRAQPFAVQKKSPGKSNLNMHDETIYLLAESYRKLHNYSLAEKWYKEAMSFSPEAYPACAYWYGVSLRANQKYDEAYETISSFRERYDRMDDLLRGADRELENLKFIKEQMNKEKNEFVVHRKQMPANTSAYASSVSEAGSLIYTTVFDDKSNERYLNRLMESSGENIGHGERILFQEEMSRFHQGLASLTRDGNKIFFTQWTVNKGITSSAIYTSDKTDTGWSKPVLMPEPVNMAGFNSAQPFVTADGKYLLFSSDRTGGVGKYDIWYAPLDSQYNALLVNNAGNVVNTTEDELSPSYHQVSRTLLFSSNGHTGMGGYDIFSAKGDFLLSDWEKPYNPGSPVNSSRDDLYFISTDEDNLWNSGWLSSDRSTDCCLELYSFTQNNAQLLYGTVIDCASNQPLAGVSLTVKDTKKNGRILSSGKTDDDGTYQFVLRNSSRFEITAAKEGYHASNKTYVIHFNAGTDTIQNNICLALIEQEEGEKEAAGIGESVTLAKFSFNQSSLGQNYYNELDSLAAFLLTNPTIVVEIGGHTDGKGSEAYNLKLAQQRVDACIRYLEKKGISPGRVIGKAYGKCCPLEPEIIDGKDNPAARKKNRRVEYRIVSGG